MASCDPTPTLTVFQIVTSTATFTSFTFSLQTQPDGECSPIDWFRIGPGSPVFAFFFETYGVDPFTGSVSTASLPLIETSVITLVNQPSTLYASCSNSSSLTTTLPPQSSAPATDTSTTTHTRNITGLITNFPPPLSPAGPPRPTTTSTPTPTGILPTSVSQSQTSNFAPIVGGAVGSFCFLIGVVAIIWLGRCVYVARSWTTSHTYSIYFLGKNSASPKQFWLRKTSCFLTL